MTKIKKLKLRYYGMIALALALGVVGAYKGVKAFQGESQNVAEAGGTIVVNNTYEAPLAPTGSEDPFLGAVTGPNLPNPNCQNNVCTYVAKGSWIDASSTLLSVASPFLQTTSSGGVLVKLDGGVGWTAASSTVSLIRLTQTGAATSSYGVSCGANAAMNGPVEVEMITTTAVMLNTQIATNSLGILENNMASTSGNRATAGAVAKIIVGPGAPWFTCVVDTQGLESFTNPLNTADGSYVIKFEKAL